MIKKIWSRTRDKWRTKYT